MRKVRLVKKDRLEIEGMKDFQVGSLLSYQEWCTNAQEFEIVIKNILVKLNSQSFRHLNSVENDCGKIDR